ncbi:hypothetical protein [Myxosarcina sp. GI1]|uniref:hypothetical protein n=1 Tax=Myxosarcina sp. GI1 TaxID=1541065 RepID=UPI0006916DC4|nr:hypothetical protein [Myxosarcina sp. GI1]
MDDNKVEKTQISSQGRRGVTQAVMRSLKATIDAADRKDLEQLSFVFEPEVNESMPSNDNSEPLWLLELENLKLLNQRRQDLLKDSLTSTQVADLMGWQHHKTASDRLKANTLIGVKDRGVYKFPLWQFDPEGEDGIVDGLPELLSRLNISNFRRINWLSQPMAAFDNLTPIEVLKKGDPNDIADLLIEADGVGVAQ